MIALNSSDKIRGDASVANKVDYTIHGVTGDVVTQLADGQCGTSEADFFMAFNNGTIVTTIILVNTHTSAITCNLYLKPSGGTSRRIIPKDMAIGIGHVLTFDGINLAVTNQQGNVVFYEEGDTVATPSGYAHLMRQADNTLTVPLIDSDRHPQVDIVELPANTFAAEDGALGKGVLVQGDDGTDRKNVLVDAAGHLQVDVVSGGTAGTQYDEDDVNEQPTGTVSLCKQRVAGAANDILIAPAVDADGHVQVDVLSGGGSNDSVATEGVAASKGTQISLDDGTDSHYAQANAAGDLKVTLDSEPVVLGTGSAAIGKLAANPGVDIGNVGVASQPADTFVADGGALGKGVLLQGNDGTYRKNVLVDPATGRLQIDVLSGGGDNDSVTTEGAVATKGTQISLDDGTDSQYAQANAAGDLKITLDSEPVVLGTGSAAIGKLAANSGVDIGDVDVKSLPNKLTAWTQVVVNINTATTTELIAASAGHTYTILTISLTIAAANNLTFKSASTAKTGPMDFGGSGEAHGWQANFWPVGIKCVTGEALNLTTTTTGQVSGIICVLDES